MDSWEQQNSLFKKSLDCYLEALGGVEKHVLNPCALKTAGQPITLDAERRLLKRQPDEPGFEMVRISLGRVLEGAADQIRRQIAGTVELADVLKLLSETTSSLRCGSDARESKFRDVASDLQLAAERADVTELRLKIFAQVLQLTQLVDEMKWENRKIVEELEREMLSYRRKLDEAEQIASRDALTGLSNRRVLQSRIHEYIQTGVAFCLILVDLNRFKCINDQYGHLAGDELLKLFSQRLKHQLRTDDTAARWGGDEFVIVLPCRLSDAMARSRLLEQSLRGDYVLRHEAKPLRIQLSLSMGVVEHKSGESADQMLARADQILYYAKSGH